MCIFYTEQWLGLDEEAAFYLAPFRIVEFAMGAILVWSAKYRPRANLVLELLLVAGLVCILVPVSRYRPDTPFPPSLPT